MSINNGDLPAMPFDMTNPRFTALVGYADLNGDRSSVNAMLGLTKREQFAMAAMQGILSNGVDFTTHEDKDVASAAVIHADNLLAELEKSK